MMTRLRRFGTRWGLWGLGTLVVWGLPQVADSNFALGLFSQMGIAVIACLSYNVLCGQGGMLSFGHAVYTGLGAYAVIHALHLLSVGAWPVPVSALPLLGGAAGLAFAALSGYPITRLAGTGLAMVTMGVGELVASAAWVWTGFSGGESGVSANRVVGPAWWGVSWGPAAQLYYLIAAYTSASVALLFAFTRTPLARLLNAARDNPERVEFLGYDPHRIRYTAFLIAGFFAGISGGLAALHFETVTADVLGPARSGLYLVFTFIGGARYFFGPILGGVLMVLALVLLSSFTPAWQLYVGLTFMVVVLRVPGGMASLCAAQWRMARAGLLGRWLWAYVAMVCTGGLALGGVAAMVEMIYQLQLRAADGAQVQFGGWTLHSDSPACWWGAAWVAITGGGLFVLVMRQFAREWTALQAELKDSPTQGRTHA